jgi:hypothetical protein
VWSYENLDFIAVLSELLETLLNGIFQTNAAGYQGCHVYSAIGDVLDGPGELLFMSMTD